MPPSHTHRENDLEAIRKEIHTLRTMVTEIHAAGDTYRPESGFVYRVAQLEAQTQELKENQRRTKWYFAGLSTASAGIATILQLLL